MSEKGEQPVIIPNVGSIRARRMVEMARNNDKNETVVIVITKEDLLK